MRGKKAVSRNLQEISCTEQISLITTYPSPWECGVRHWYVFLLHHQKLLARVHAWHLRICKLNKLVNQPHVLQHSQIQDSKQWCCKSFRAVIFGWAWSIGRHGRPPIQQSLPLWKSARPTSRSYRWTRGNNPPFLEGCVLRLECSSICCNYSLNSSEGAFVVHRLVSLPCKPSKMLCHACNAVQVILEAPHSLFFSQIDTIVSTCRSRRGDWQDSYLPSALSKVSDHTVKGFWLWSSEPA